MRVVGLILVGLMTMALGGCLERLAELVLSPVTGAANAVNDTGDAMTESTLGGNNVQAVNDIDRILAENPETANRAELQAMRNQLAGQQTAGAVPVGTVTSNRSMRREAPIDRTLPRRQGDKVRRLSLYQADGTLSLHPDCAVIPPTAVVFGNVEPFYSTNFAPVRMR